MLRAEFFKFRIFILPPLGFCRPERPPTLALPHPPQTPVRRRIEANGVGKSRLKVSDLQHKRNWSQRTFKVLTPYNLLRSQSTQQFIRSSKLNARWN